MTLNLKLNHKPDNSVAVAEMIDRHVRCNVSGLVTEILDTCGLGGDHGHLSHTDITVREMRACVADAGYEIHNLSSPLQPRFYWLPGRNFETHDLAFADCIHANNLDPARYAREPVQWLAVSDWLCDALREHGETVRVFPGSGKNSLNIWLRCTAGELIDDIALRSVWETAG